MERVLDSSDCSELDFGKAFVMTGSPICDPSGALELSTFNEFPCSILYAEDSNFI